MITHINSQIHLRLTHIEWLFQLVEGTKFQLSIMIQYINDELHKAFNE